MKKITLLKSMLLLCALVAGSTSVWATEPLKYITEGFETKSAGSDYQSTVTIDDSESDCGIGWELYYGTVSTSSKITGTNSVALRLYTTANYGYLKTTTPIDGLTKVDFIAKAATSNGAAIKINISYSTDGTSWTNIVSAMSLTSSAAGYSFDIPSGGKHFKIAIAESSTKPSKSNAQLTIDDVKFYTKAVGGVFYESMSSYTETSDAALTIDDVNLDSDLWDSFTNGGMGKKLATDTNGHILFGRSGSATSMVTKSLSIKGDATLTFRAQRYDSSNNGPLIVSVTGATATGDVSAEGDGSNAVWVDKTVNITGATGNVVITFSVASGKRIRIDDILLVQEEVPATITDAEYATFVSPYATDFSTTGISVYTATDEETQVTLNEISSGKVPANTPVVLHKAGADGTPINVPVVASADTPAGTNDLRVSTGTDVSDMYVLSKKNGKVGFRAWAGTTDLSAGKIYLQGKASYGAREFLGFGDATAINKVEAKMAENGVFYNLAGQQVAQPSKGLYIMNGRKVIVK